MSAKRNCVMFLSCIGDMPRYFLPLSDEFHETYDFRPFIYNSNSLFDTMQDEVLANLNDADVLIYHPAEILLYEEALIQKYSRMLSKVPSRVTKIGIGQPHFHAFWPFHANDPRNGDMDRPKNRYGRRPSWLYGDSYVIKLLGDGVPEEEIFRRYMAEEFSDSVDLAKRLEFTLRRTGEQDDACDVKILKYVKENFRTLSLYQTINHANNRLMFYISNSILDLCGCAAIDAKHLLQAREIIDLPMPIHPYIAKYFQLEFADEKTRYMVDKKRCLTFEEYIHDYIFYEYGYLD